MKPRVRIAIAEKLCATCLAADTTTFPKGRIGNTHRARLPPGKPMRSKATRIRMRALHIAADLDSIDHRPGEQGYAKTKAIFDLFSNSFRLITIECAVDHPESETGLPQRTS